MVRILKTLTIFTLLFTILFTITPVNTFAKDNSFKAIDIEKKDTSVNISIDTNELKNDLETITEKTKDGYDKLKETGFFDIVLNLFNSILTLFINFIETLFSMLK